MQKKQSVTDGLTDRWTDEQTDTVTYRVARTRLKRFLAFSLAYMLRVFLLRVLDGAFRQGSWIFDERDGLAKAIEIYDSVAALRQLIRHDTCKIEGYNQYERERARLCAR